MINYEKTRFVRLKEAKIKGEEMRNKIYFGIGGIVVSS